MLKKVLFTVGIILFIIAIWFVGVMNATGFFRTIDAVSFGNVYQEIPIKGAEDFTIDYESGLMFVSAFDRAGAVRGESPIGALHVIDLKIRPFEATQLPNPLGEGFHPHGIYVTKIDSAKYDILVVNHQNDKHTIERFDYEKDKLTHVRTFDHELILSPNDIVALDGERFYFTNDHGKSTKLGVLAENYLGLAASNVVYFDGSDFQIAADGIKYANGINISENKKTLYIASPRAFKIKTYSIQPTGQLIEMADLDVGTGVDNLEWDDSGNLWSGAHPNLLRFSAYAKLKKETAPSEVVRVAKNQVETIFLDDDSLVSASSVALPYEDFLFIGTVMDDKLLVLKAND